MFWLAETVCQHELPVDHTQTDYHLVQLCRCTGWHRTVCQHELPVDHTHGLASREQSVGMNWL